MEGIRTGSQDWEESRAMVPIREKWWKHWLRKVVARGGSGYKVSRC